MTEVTDLLFDFRRRLSIATKAGLAVFSLLALVAIVQAATVRVAMGEVLGPPSWRVFLFFAIPSLIGSGFAGVVMMLMARRRARAMIEALRKVGAGDLTARLPPAPDAEFIAVQDAFHAMGQALREARDELQQSDAQRRRLFADLAHELATPASSILGVCDTLARPELCPTEEARARLLSNLERESNRLARLVEDVRDLANLDDPDVRIEKKTIDVAALAERIARDADVTLERDEGPVSVEADPIRIEQVLVNLLRNAQRYTPRGGAIVIRAATRGTGAVLELEDAGPGVPDHVLERLGERLFRVDPSRDRRTGGHGLGLSIVRAIVERHGGAVTFGRSPLGGLRATLTLPSA